MAYDTVYHKRGATEMMLPNSTQIPDIIFDRWLSVLSGAEIKVVLYVARRTYGFRRTSDNISLDQMAKGIVTRDGRRLDGGTGLSRETVAKTVASLEEKGILTRERHKDESGGNLPSTFALNLATQFGVEVAPPRKGVSKSDPIPDETTGGNGNGGDDSRGRGSEKHTPSLSKGVSESDQEGVEESDPVGYENLTYKIQCLDIQSLDRQIYIQQQQTDTPTLETNDVPDPKSVVVDSCVKNTNTGLVESLTAIGITESKAKILAENHPDRIVDQIAYLPHRSPREPARVLIRAIEGNWSQPEAHKSAQQEAFRQKRDAESKAKILEAQQAEKQEADARRTKFAAAWDTLSHERRGDFERQAWRIMAQQSGPVGVKAKDVLRGDLKASEAMVGNAVRCVFQRALEEVVLSDEKK